MTSLTNIDLTLPFYPTINKLNSFQMLNINNTNSLVMLYFNARSIKNKIEELDCILSQIKTTVHLIAISETWLSDEDNTCLSVKNYSTITSSRKNRSGGGVALLVHKSVNNFDCIDTYSDDFLNSLSVKIFFNNSDFLINVCYNPPNMNSVRYENFFDVLNNSLSNIKNKNSIVVGDFNINLLDSNKTVTEYKSVLNSNNFYICDENTPTRDISGSVLDHLIINNLNQSVVVNHINCGISDHNIMVCEFASKNNNISNKVNSDNTFIKKSINYKKFIQSFESDKLSINIEDSLNNKCDVFIKDIQLRISNATTSKIIKSKNKRCVLKPWINESLQQIINKKHFWYLKLKKERKSPIVNLIIEEKLKNEYNYWKKKVNLMKRELKIKFFDNQFMMNMGNCRGTWNSIKNVLYDGIPPSKPEINLCINGILTGDKQQIVNEFNNFFATAGELLAKNFDNSSFDDTFEKQSSNDVFQLNPTNEEEVLKVIASLKNTESSGIDGIKTKVIKMCAKHLAKPLADLINESFLVGTFPNIFKVNKVFPVYKKGIKNDKNNYRQISLTSVFSKIIEIIFKIRLMEYIETNNILCRQQYGFRARSNTQAALFDLVAELQAGQKNTKKSSLFLDLSKAFDCVNHQILLIKLEKIGFSGSSLNWISSYLQGRKQMVVINGVSSNPQSVQLGVPQGSILGPILFLLYINSLESIGLKGELFLYADDVLLW